MKWLLVPASAVALLVSLAAAAEVDSRSPASNAVVLLMVNTPREKGLGHAFAIADGSLLVAARHVVFNANDTTEYQTLGLLTVFSPYLGEFREARLVAENREADVAILRWSGMGHPALTLATDQEIRAAKEMEVPAWFELGSAMSDYDPQATTRPVTPQIERLDVDFLGLRAEALRLISLNRKGFNVQRGWSGSPAVLTGTTKVAGVVRNVRTRGGQPAAVEASPVPMFQHMLEQFPAARNSATTAPATRPADADKIMTMTREMWMAWGRKDRMVAREKVEKLIAARPDNPLYRSRLAFLAQQLGDRQTEQFFKDALAHEEGTLEAMVYYSQYLEDHQRHDDALALLRELKRAAPLGSLWALGWYNVYESQKKQAQVVDVLREAVKVAPSDGVLWVNLGQAQHAAKDDRAAVESFERAAQLMPKMLEIRMLLAQSLDATGQTQRAEAMYRQWLRDQPESQMAHLMLSQFLLRQGPQKLHEALREAESALALPSQPGAPPPDFINKLREAIRSKLAQSPTSTPASGSTTGPADDRTSTKPSDRFRL